MATKASRSSIMSYYGLFCPELAFSRRSAHKGKRMELRNHLRRKFVHRTGQDFGDKSMVYPASPAGLVLRSRVKTPSLSQSSSMAARRLSSSLALKASNKFRSIIFSTDCSISRIAYHGVGEFVEVGALRQNVSQI